MTYYVNFHSHAYRMPEGKFERRLEKALQGIDVIVISALEVPFDFMQAHDSYFEGNDRVMELHDKFGERIVPFAYIDPRKPDSCDELEKLISVKGFKGVKLYPPIGFYPDDPGLLPFFKKMEGLDVPALFHTGIVAPHPTLSSKYAQPIYLEGILHQCPRLKVIISHFGYPWYWEALGIANLNKNLYIDLTTGGQREVFFIKKAIEVIGSERLLFGTDDATSTLIYFLEIKTSLQNAGISLYDLNKIFGLNAVKLLRLPQFGQIDFDL